ncbi:MAG: TIGR03936 family radical SAM-associated protein [Oscillospiraceae bacterium]|nr:TIGR03936 family radical SAM-associated protein [Oscillospiraceae bacterium]
MRKMRLCFSKTGTAVYISHLDLMRTFQRAFLRAELPVRHTEGFNPHAFVSIALPLSVGFSSVCELLDFDLEDETPVESVPGRLNCALPDGIRVSGCYASQRPIRDLMYIAFDIQLIYDNGIPENAGKDLDILFAQGNLTVLKKSKKRKKAGKETEVNIAPLIQRISFAEENGILHCSAVLRAQDPGLNPRYLIKVIETYAPALAPDFSRYHRNSVYDRDLLRFF